MIYDKRKRRAAGESDAYELVVQNRQGELKWWLISGAPRYDDKGQMVGTIGIHLDITQRKKLEEQLREASGMLPFSAEVHLLRGYALAHLGKKAEAVERYATFVKLMPRHPAAAAVRRIITAERRQNPNLGNLLQDANSRINGSAAPPIRERRR